MRTVTLVQTDFEDAPRLWAATPDAMAYAAGVHREIVAAAVARHGGERPAELPGHDAVVARFSRPTDAVGAALDIQRGVSAGRWPESLGDHVRIALHTYGARGRLGLEDTAFGGALSRCTRLRAIAHGGQTVLSRSTHELVADRLPGEARLLDLGVHRLPDLGPPEHVYELTHPELPADRRSLRSLDALPNNLPRELTTFIGRERELEEVCKVLDGTRLLTLTGSGGCGKTRLALQAAADCLGRFPDGVWLVELATITDPELAGEALARAVGVRPLPGQSALEAAVANLAKRRVLVVLDNCEHLAGGAGEVATAVLQACPEATVLATSRAPLGLPGEITWRVPSLSLPPGVDGADSNGVVAHSDAIRLFVDRAVRVRPDFTVSPATVPALRAVCSELDGIPLAIELAAARVRMLSVEQIAAGLSDRFHLLTNGDQTALPRHGTLRASVDWSYELLSEEERTLFRRLGVFKGTFTLEAVQSVASVGRDDGAGVLDVLAALVDKSLVVAEEHGAAVRYRLLETVREYALERLESAGELGTLRNRHRDFFLALAEEAAPKLVTGRHREWLAALDADAANLAAALEWATAHDHGSALRLCVALTFWWKLRGMFVEADAGCARALAAADPMPSVLRARVMWGRAYLLTFAGRYVDAWTLAEEARDLAEVVGDASTLARSLFVLGTILHSSDPQQCRPLYERSCELARESGDDWCLAAATSGNGWSYLVVDEYDEACRLLEEGRPLIERHGYQELVAWTLSGTALRHAVEGNFDRFFDLSEAAVDAAREVGEPVSEGTAHAVMGGIELSLGRTERALERLEASRERLIATGAGLPLPQTNIALSLARAALGDLETARAGLEEAIASGADGGWALLWGTIELAEMLRTIGDAAGSEELAARTIEMTDRIGNRTRRAGAYDLQARLAADRAEWREAEVLAHQALALREELSLRLWWPQSLDTLAEVAAGLERHEEAVRLMAASERARGELGLVRWPPDRPDLEALEDGLRATLGEEAFEAAWEEGSGLAPEDAIAWVRRGRGSRKRPAGGWEGLTPTEVEVARHAAAGMTNVEIGEAMFISRGTVKTHLSHIYAKLGVRNRAELTAEAAQRLPAVGG